MKKGKTGTVLRLLKYMSQHFWGLLLAVGLTMGSNLFALLGYMFSCFMYEMRNGVYEITPCTPFDNVV